MTVKVGINGYGRIGRSFHRALLARKDAGVSLVAINDPNGDNDTHAYLLQYDSVGRTLPNQIEATERGIMVDGEEVPRYSVMNPDQIQWGAHDIDIAIDSTGIFASREAAARHLIGGAKRVVISAPADDADLTICMGINDGLYDPSKHHVVSNASCTTNCLAPMARVLHEAFGLDWGFLHTVHAYTGDQALHDVAKTTRSGKPDFRRMRAAGLSIIPSSTGAARAIGLVLPDLKGRLDGMSTRVPTPTGSLTDLVAHVNTAVTKDQVNEAFIKASEDPSYRGVLKVTDRELVSADIIGNSASCIVSLRDTMVMPGTGRVKVLGWYDNEAGYSNRLVDLCLRMAGVGI